MEKAAEKKEGLSEADKRAAKLFAIRIYEDIYRDIMNAKNKEKQDEKI